MPIYQAHGTLTDTIAYENIAAAQECLTQHDMTQFVDEPLRAKLERIQWQLRADGHNWTVEAVAREELSDDELKALQEWVHGQNSDGLGEVFEQQEFAELKGECGDCTGCDNGWECDDESYGMISFDWKTNRVEFERVA